MRGAAAMAASEVSVSRKTATRLRCPGSIARQMQGEAGWLQRQGGRRDTKGPMVREEGGEANKGMTDG